MSVLIEPLNLNNIAVVLAIGMETTEYNERVSIVRRRAATIDTRKV